MLVGFTIDQILDEVIFVKRFLVSSMMPSVSGYSMVNFMSESTEFR